MVNAEYWSCIEGWFDWESLYKAMVDRCEEGSHFVEVGAWFGKSMCFLATQVALLGKQIKLDAVDLWKDTPFEFYNNIISQVGGDLLPVFMNHMKKAGVDHLITPLQMSSIEASKLYLDESLDFVFIDADHETEGVTQDIEHWWPKVKIGGYLAGHDYQLATVRAAVDHQFKYVWIFRDSPLCWVIPKESKFVKGQLLPICK